jgi:hypothetical protein
MRTLARTPFDHDTFAAAAGTRHRVTTWLAIAGVAGSLAAGVAHAQGGVPCTAIENDAERLACYDRALRGTPAAPETPSARDQRREERNVRRAEAPAPQAAPSPAPAATPPPAAVARPTQATATPAIVPLVIVGVRALPGRGATFTTEDGQVWIQTDTQRVLYPDVPFSAELKPGAMGSYFLVPKDRRAVRVRQQRD